MDLEKIMLGTSAEKPETKSWSLFETKRPTEEKDYLQSSTVELNAVVSLKEGQAANRAAL